MRVLHTGIAIVTIAVVAATGCAQQSGGGAPAGRRKPGDKLAPATIFIYGSDAKNCTAKVSPYTFQPNKNEWAFWTVIDTCGVTNNYTENVEVLFLASGKTCDGKEFPIEGSTNSATGARFIEARINPKCTSGDVFKYDVKVAGTKLTDPELEIGQ